MAFRYEYKGFTINFQELQYADQAMDNLANKMVMEGYRVVSHSVSEHPNFGFFVLSMLGERQVRVKG